MNINKSISLFQEAQTLFPGGVNSPVRAFRAVGGQPLFIDHGEGPYLYDVDGNRYIDYVLSWGPLITGHAHPSVVKAIPIEATVLGSILSESLPARGEKIVITMGWDTRIMPALSGFNPFISCR